MDAYLFVWNPKKYEQLHGDYEEWLKGDLKKIEWSSGVSKSIPEGARVFLMRLGKKPKGIIAAGHTVSGWHQAPDGHGGDGLMNANDLSFDDFVDPNSPRTPIERLREIDECGPPWTHRGSGVRIRDDWAKQLEEAWAEAVKEV